MSRVDQELLNTLSLLGIEYWEEALTPISSIEPTSIKQELNSTASVETIWNHLQERVKNCTACNLCQTRIQTVFGVGNQNAKLMLIGEAPGATEDRRGEPFVGQAGQLLDKMLAAIQLSRQEVYIANILKCRPPNNRDPQVDEVEKCLPFLLQQIDLIKPKLILALGRIAAQNLLKTQTALGKLRNQTFQFGEHKTPMIVTYHPAYLLRNPADKRNAYQDLLRVKEFLEKS